MGESEIMKNPCLMVQPKTIGVTDASYFAPFNPTDYILIHFHKLMKIYQAFESAKEDLSSYELS